MHLLKLNYFHFCFLSVQCYTKYDIKGKKRKEKKKEKYFFFLFRFYSAQILPIHVSIIKALLCNKCKVPRTMKTKRCTLLCIKTKSSHLPFLDSMMWISIFVNKLVFGKLKHEFLKTTHFASPEM